MADVSLIGERFELLTLAGRGGMGVVWRALDRRTGDIVAVKLLRTDEGRHAERFAQEIELVRQLEHPTIVRYIESGTTDEGDAWFAMEWLEGLDLAACLKSGPLSLEKTLEFGIRVAGALGHAHARGIVHRDVKPQNLMLASGEVSGVKVLDFGVAKLLASGRSMTVQDGSFLVGSPRYMAPEQARGDEGIDARADVFSLGCVLYECLSGSPVFGGDGIEAVLAKVLFETPARLSSVADAPRALDDLLESMLQKDRSRRPADGHAVARALEAVRESLDEATTLIRVEEVPASREQRWASVLLTGEWHVGPRLEPEAATVTSRERPSVVRLAEIAEASHAKMESLRNGSHVFVWSGGGLANDVARRAASASLAIASVFTGTPMVLVTGLAAEGSALPVGTALDRAAAKLADARRLGATRLFIDEATASLVGERFEVRGEAEDRVLVAERQRAPGVRTLLGRVTPCLGREEELSMLGSSFELCTTESAAVAVVVTAEAGVGKSRLRHEFVSRCAHAAPGTHIWVAECDPTGADTAYRVAATLARDALGVPVSATASEVREAVRDRVARNMGASDARRVESRLCELLGVQVDDAVDPSLVAARREPTVLRDQLCAAWEDFLAAESLREPVLLVVEDVQWADRPSVELIERALRNFADWRIMVLALGRPEAEQRFPSLWVERGARRLVLPPLSGDASEAIVRSVLGAWFDSDRIAAVVERAGGNAFFLEELTRAEAQGAGDRVPESVLAMVADRIGALDRISRRTLRAASVFGGAFDARGVDFVARSVEAQGVLERLEDEEFVVRLGDGRWGFRNAVVREAAYGQFVEEARCAAHERAAEWLAVVEPTNAARIAEHLELAGALPRAAVWWAAATEYALVGGEFSAVAHHAARAEACGATGEAFARACLALSDAHLWRGQAPERLAVVERAIAQTDAPRGIRVRALAAAANAASHLGDLERLAVYAERLGTELERADVGEAEVAAASRANEALFLSGMRDAGDRLSARIQAAYARVPEPSAAVRARFLLLRSIDLRTRPQPNLEATALAQQQAARAFDEARDIRGACLARTNAAYALTQLGAYDEAIPEFRASLADATRLGVDYLTASTQQNLGYALGCAGFVDEAVELERASIESSARGGNRAMEAGSTIYLSRIFKAAGRITEAEATARSATTMLPVSHPMHRDAVVALADALLAKAEPSSRSEALGLARAAHDALLAAGGNSEEPAFIRRVYIDALEANGLAEQAAIARAEARSWVLARAAALQSERYRQSFLYGEPDNARIMAEPR